MASKKALSAKEQKELLQVLQVRFEKNQKRHVGIQWAMVELKLLKHPEKMWSLQQMEASGGEPDVVAYNSKTNTFTFMDCAAESPAGRRSLCYDKAAWDERKENKPAGSVMEMAAQMGVSLLDESQYRSLQALGKFDTKTSSWIVTPPGIRKLGGALFADYRYDTVFVYHNGAQSYYAARGFRTALEV